MSWRYGAAALDLAYIAAGRFDIYWERGLSSWDIAAGSILVREAGGYISDLAGRDGYMGTGDVIAGNETMQKELIGLLRKAQNA
jgi:myo-inositol-1(or 4)-monophosphatase